MPGKALVIDNDFFFVEFLSEILENRGYEVLKAYDGKEGVAKLEPGPVDLLFVDMVMPKIDGRQFIEYARRRYPDDPFPIIAISGTIIEQLDKLKKIGANFFLAKGPLEKMTIQINRMMDHIERYSGEAIVDDAGTFDQSDLFPRMETAELIENINFCRAIIASIGIGVIVVDKDARIITGNDVALDVLDRPIEKVLNRPVVAMFSESTRPTVIAALKQTVRQPETGKQFFIAETGTRRVRVTVSLLRLDDKAIGFVFALEDSE